MLTWVMDVGVVSNRTEIDAITGRIVAVGKRHGIPTPTNEMLLFLIQALEEEGTRRICTPFAS